MVMRAPGCERSDNSVVDRNAARVLAVANEMARKVSGGECGRVATGAAADGAGFLSAGGDGSQRPHREIVGGAVRPYLGVYIFRIGRGVGVIQLAIRCAAAGCGVRKR